LTPLNLPTQPLLPPTPTTPNAEHPTPERRPTIQTHDRRALAARLPWLETYVSRGGRVPLSRHPAWMTVLERGLGHTPYCLEAVAEGKTVGVLPLAYVRSLLFGRFLVGLPYLNYGGPQADDAATAGRLLDEAAALADRLKVRYLELRSEAAADHPKFERARADKVHMRLALPATAGALWDQLSTKVRNQVRKGQKSGLTVAWGTHDVLGEFHDVFSENMRDLGTPGYGRKLFAATLEQFPGRAELCVVRAEGKPVAAGLLLHGWGVTEVPSASSLRSHNHTCANMLLYWNLLQRSVERGQAVFDFGRSSQDSPTFRFKKQWGAEPVAAQWQCYARSGSSGEMRPDNPSYGRLVRLWRRLPLWLTRRIGPSVVRGIP
jgi:FemAB-related protein (PEP-CTERM system-associated)